MTEIQSYEHACEILKRDPANRPDNSRIEENDVKALDSLFDLMIITRAQNKLRSAVIDLTNRSQYKHFPVFTAHKKPSGAGVGLSLFAVVYDHLAFVVGSRLSSSEEEDAEYIAETFPSKFEDWLVE